MLSIDRSLGRTSGAAAAAPLPTVYEALEDLGVKFRRGQISMVAAAPGAGKTMFAQHLALRAKVPTVFFSADTDEHTMAVRAVANLTGRHQAEIAAADPASLEQYADLLGREAQHIAWDYESDHSPEQIEDIFKAFAMVYGEWPHLVVFDVLMSYQTASGDWSATNEFMLNCKTLAAMSNAHIMVLHHVVGAFTDKSAAPPRSAIINKADQLPSLILTLGAGDGQLNVCVAKSRNSPADPRAERPLKFSINPSTVQISEPKAWSYA